MDKRVESKVLLFLAVVVTVVLSFSSRFPGSIKSESLYTRKYTPFSNKRVLVLPITNIVI